MHRDNGSFFTWVEYRSDLYEEETIKHLIETYDRVLEEFLTKEKTAEVDLVSEKERLLLDSFNKTDVSCVDFKRTVLDGFKGAAKKFPDRFAVVFKDK